MERRHPAVLVICVLALGAAIAASVVLSASVSRSGKPALAEAARGFGALLKRETTGEGVQAFLARGNSVRDPRVAHSLAQLGRDLSRANVLARVETVRGEHGTTTFLVSDGGRLGSLSQRTLEWHREPDGRWRVDVLGEAR